MPKKRHTEEQIVAALRQGAGRGEGGETCRRGPYSERRRQPSISESHIYGNAMIVDDPQVLAPLSR